MEDSTAVVVVVVVVVVVFVSEVLVRASLSFSERGC